MIFFLFVQHSSEQGFNFDNDPSNEVTSNEVSSTEASVSGTGSLGIVGTLRNTINNTASNLLLRLEGPKDRVIQFIRPAVRSEFSRNVTNALTSIWGRVQESNISLIQNPFVKNSIVKPINITLTRIKEITDPKIEDSEVVDGTNYEVVTLSNLETVEVPTTEYIVSSASDDVVSNPITEHTLEKSVNNESTNSLDTNTDQPIDDKTVNNDDEVNNQLNQNNSNDKLIDNEQSIDLKPVINEVKPIQDKSLNPVKSIKKRAAPFIDNYVYVPSDLGVRGFFDNVQRRGLQQCLAFAFCESICNPYLYQPFYAVGRPNVFSRLFNRLQSSGSAHPDYDYYLNARRYGVSSYRNGMTEQCVNCRSRYYCPQERSQLVNQFSELDQLY